MIDKYWHSAKPSCQPCETNWRLAAQVSIPTDDAPSLWELEELAAKVLGSPFPDAFEDYSGWADAHRSLDEVAHAPVMTSVPEWPEYDPAGALLAAWKGENLFHNLAAIWFPSDFTETVRDANRVAGVSEVRDA